MAPDRFSTAATAARPLALAVAAALLAMAAPASAQADPQAGAAASAGARMLAQAGTQSTGTQNTSTQAADAQTPSLPEVRIEAGGRTPATERAGVGGIGDAPLAETPQSISVIRAETLRDLGAGSLSAAMRAESSAGDFYNTVGYIEAVQLRGFRLDNELNYRRDGLRISNHAPLALENKAAIEVLKGVSGLQSGLSTPGGLINYVLKRPTEAPLREVFLGLSERGTALVHGDFGGRLGEGRNFGYRVNVSAEERRPEARNAPGDRRFVSGYFDLRLPGNALLEAEIEHHRVRQRSVPAFGLLDVDGDGVAETLPPPVDPRINLNDQPWSQPFESRATTGSLRFQQALSTNWHYGLRYGAQHIRTDDRLAFPDGCSSGPNDVYPGFCGNHDFDVYDFRSENERRDTRTAEAFLRGSFDTGGVRHELSLGFTRTRYTERFEPMQAYNWVGIGNVFERVVLPEDPTKGDLNTLRDATTREFHVYDAMRFGGGWSLWLGARHTRLERSSERTDGSRAVAYEQSLTTPWAALGWQPWQGGFVYVSAGSGVETEVVPNRPTVYANYGEVLPALRSRQAELGFKQVLQGAGLFSVALFQIEKPYADDVERDDGLLLRVPDGREFRHRGLELAWAGRPLPSLLLQAQATLIDSDRIRSLDAGLLGASATNVAPFTASLVAGWQVPGADGLVWTNRLFYSSRKPVTEDNSVKLPSFWQLDTALSWQQRAGDGTALTWRLGVDNVFDRRYWREAPTQYWGGTYLLPAAPRTVRASLQISF